MRVLSNFCAFVYLSIREIPQVPKNDSPPFTAEIPQSKPVNNSNVPTSNRVSIAASPIPPTPSPLPPTPPELEDIPASPLHENPADTTLDTSYEHNNEAETEIHQNNTDPVENINTIGAPMGEDKGLITEDEEDQSIYHESVSEDVNLAEESNEITESNDGDNRNQSARIIITPFSKKRRDVDWEYGEVSQISGWDDNEK
jgi:hypothetical protein